MYIQNKPCEENHVWLCHDCKERNQLVPTNNSNSHSAEEEADETADTGAEENAEERQSPRRNMPGQVNAAKEDVPANTDTVNPPPFDGQQSAPKIAQRRDTKASDNRQNLENRPVCELYKKHCCPHGVSGKVRVDRAPCPNPHPSLCNKFIQKRQPTWWLHNGKQVLLLPP